MQICYNGQETQWNNVTMVKGHSGIMLQWPTDTIEYCYNGQVTRWNNVTMAKRHSGIMLQWLSNVTMEHGTMEKCYTTQSCRL